MLSCGGEKFALEATALLRGPGGGIVYFGSGPPTSQLLGALIKKLEEG